MPSARPERPKGEAPSGRCQTRPHLRPGEEAAAAAGGNVGASRDTRIDSLWANGSSRRRSAGRRRAASGPADGGGGVRGVGRGTRRAPPPPRAGAASTRHRLFPFPAAPPDGSRSAGGASWAAHTKSGGSSVAAGPRPPLPASPGRRAPTAT